MKHIALYGGTFSPPHISHASVVEAILRLFPCDQIWILLSADRHDKKASASGKDRVQMWEILNEELFSDSKIPIKISTIELERGRPTETYETKLELEEKYPDHEFYLVVGADLVRDIPYWQNGEKLFHEMNFVVINKPYTELPDILPSHIDFIDTIWTNISSTFVRELIAKGYSGTPYITPGVAKYIKENNLYK